MTNSRGQLHTILATPRQCQKCGTPTTNYQVLSEKDFHESVLDTLHRGDSRFIIDHRRFANSRDPRSSPKNNEKNWTSSSPMDCHNDLESFRLHMSRQSQIHDDLETRDQASEQKRSESGSSVFMTEPGANIDKLNETPEMRCSWDDVSAQAEVGRGYDNNNGDWGKGRESGSNYSDNDSDSFSDFEMIEDYDPKSGFTVRLRRRPFGGAHKTSYLIHGIQDEEADNENSISRERKAGLIEKENLRHKRETHLVRKNANKQISADRKGNKQRSHDINDNEQELENVKHKRNNSTKLSKSPRHSLPRTDSFYTVGLDRRDYVFSEEPVIEESDEDDVIIDPRTRFTEDSLSDIEFITDTWSPNHVVPGVTNTPMTPSDQVIFS